MNEPNSKPMGGPGGPGGPGGRGGGPPKAGYTEIKPESSYILTETEIHPNGLVIEDGNIPIAAEGKALLMTVDGVVTNITPGIYPGKVVLTVYELSHVPEDQAELSSGDFRTALYVMDGKLVPTGIEQAAGAFETEKQGITDVEYLSEANDMNGIIVGAHDYSETPFEISDSWFSASGSGTSEGRGAVLMTVGKANVKLDGANIWNYGTLSAIVASGESHLEVANSVIYGEKDFSAGKLCPWVLGINGNNRLTNAIDNAKVYYHDSIVVAESWAALSTDSGRGVRLVGENLFSGIGRLEPYEESHAADYTAVPELNGEKYGFYLGNSAIGECGYVNYADGFHNSFRDVTFYAPDYIFILSSGQASIDVEGDSYCHSGRFGILWHKNQGGTVSLKGGKWYAEDALVLAKSYSSTDTAGCFCNVLCDGTDIKLGKGGVLYQLMTSDDMGLTPGQVSVYTVPEIEADLSRVEKLPETYRAQKMEQGFPPFVKYPIYQLDGQEVTVREDEAGFLAAHPDAVPAMYDAPYRIQSSTFTLKNLCTEGDIFNGVYERIQVLDVTLENAVVKGRISSAYTFHVDAAGNPCAPGTTYSKAGKEDEHLGIGRVGNTPAPAINNPVHLTLKSGAQWTPTGTCYLEQLTMDGSAVIHGTVSVDGETVSAPGTYTGNIVVTP